MSRDRTRTGRAAVACALAEGAMGERFAEWAALARRALVGRRRHEAGVALRYRRAAGVEAELRRLVAAEASCCEFLDFAFDEEDPEEVVLTVSGPPEAAALIRGCWGVRRGPTPARSSTCPS